MFGFFHLYSHFVKLDMHVMIENRITFYFIFLLIFYSEKLHSFLCSLKITVL